MSVKYLIRAIRFHHKVLCFTLLVASVLPTVLIAEDEAEMSNGELAGIIRSADMPCNHVVEFQKTGKNSWLVTCNSGVFSVKADDGGNFVVNSSN